MMPLNRGPLDLYPCGLNLELGAAMPRIVLPVAMLMSLSLLTPNSAWAQSPRDKAEARKHIAQFKLTDKKVIAGAAGALIKMKKRAVPSLIEALADKHPKVRSYSAGTLIRMGGPAIPACVEALASSDKNRRGLAVNVLTKIGKPAIPAVKAAAQSKNPRRAEAARYILKKWGQPVPEPKNKPSPKNTPQPKKGSAKFSIEELIAFLNDADPKKREAAAIELARKGQAALKPMIAVLSDKDALKREYAAYGLGFLGQTAKPAVPALVKLFKDSNPAVRQRAVMSVCMIGIKDLVADKDLLATGEQNAQHFAKALASQHVFVRSNALLALKVIGSKAKAAIPEVTAALGDKDGRIRVAAIHTLTAIGPSAVPALRKALNSASADQRMNALYALGNLKAKDALSDVERLAKDKNGAVRKAAAWAKAKIAGQDSGKTPGQRPSQRPGQRPGNPTPSNELVAHLFGRHRGKQQAAEKELRSSNSVTTIPPIIQYICSIDKRARRQKTSYLAGVFNRMGARAVPGLVKALSSKNKDEQELALRFLASGNMRKAAAPELRALLASKDNATRRAAAQALGRMSNYAQPAIPALVKCLSDPDAGVKQAAIVALGTLDTYAADSVKAALNSKDKSMQAAGLEVLARMRSGSALAATHATRLINVVDPKLRRSAARALCATRPTLSKEQMAALNSNAALVLAEQLRSRSEKVANYAALLLSSMGGQAKGAGPAVVALFKNVKKSPGFRGLLASIIARSGPFSDDVVPALGVALNDKDVRLSGSAGRALEAYKERAYPALGDIMKALRAEYSGTRERARMAAGAVGPKAIPVLIKGLGDDTETFRFNCAYALGIIGAPAIPQLVKEAASKDWKRRETSVCALGEMGPVAAGQVPLIGSLLKDSSWQVRKSAAYACGKVGPKASPNIPSLRRCLKDKTRDVVQAAAVGLGKIGPASAVAVDDLRKLLADTDRWTVARSAAARALGRIGVAARKSAELLALVTLNGNEPTYLRKDAQWALKRVVSKAEWERLLKKKK